MKKAVFEIWGEMMEEPELTSLKDEQMINEALANFWKNINEATTEFKVVKNVLNAWLDEFLNP